MLPLPPEADSGRTVSSRGQRVGSLRMGTGSRYLCAGLTMVAWAVIATIVRDAAGARLLGALGEVALLAPFLILASWFLNAPKPWPTDDELAAEPAPTPEVLAKLRAAAANPKLSLAVREEARRRVSAAENALPAAANRSTNHSPKEI